MMAYVLSDRVRLHLDQYCTTCMNRFTYRIPRKLSQPGLYHRYCWRCKAWWRDVRLPCGGYISRRDLAGEDADKSTTFATS